MSWQFLILISILMSAVAVLLQRILLDRDKNDPIAYAIVFQGTVGVILTIIALFHGFHLPDFGKYWLAILVTTLFYAAGNVVSAKGLKQTEASIFAVLFTTNAVWVMIAGILLFGEHLSILQIFGAILIFVSVGLLADRTGKLKFDTGILLSLLSGFIYGFAISGWVYVAKHNDLVTWNAVSFLLPATLTAVLSYKSIPKMKPFLSGRIMQRMLLLGILFSISTLALLSAFIYGNASIVAPLQQTNTIVTILLAVIFLHERNNLIRKFIAAAICFAGAVMIVS